jgi:RNA polymerase sigma-70 factor, ECF subfamily
MAQSDMSTESDFRMATALALGLSASEEQMSLEEQVARSFERWRHAIYRYLTSAGATPNEAEDITQEAFFRLFRTLLSGKRIENAHHWLFRVAQNLLVDRGRHIELLSTALPEVAQEADKKPDPHPTPEEILMDSERSVQVHRAVQTLTANQRNCLNLRAEGFRHREIAEILGLSMSSVADALRRAITRLSREQNE